MAQTDLWNRSSQRSVPAWLPVVAGVLIAARIISCRYETRSSVDLIKWVPTAQAERMARMTHKPILYEFSAEWCGPCHMLEREVFRNPKLARLINERFIPVKLVDRQRETGGNPPDVARLQGIYRVDAFPTVVIAQGSDSPITNVGFQGADDFEAFLRKAL